MDKLAIFMVIASIGACACINSWEIPKSKLWKYVDHDLDENWLTYKIVYNKTYSGYNEEMKRRLYWESSKRLIEDHNKKYERGEFTYLLGENHLSDLSEDEFQKIYMTGLIIPEDAIIKEEADDEQPETPFEANDLPSRVDWRDRGAVGKVRDQGACGSCWAFSAIGALEAQQKIKRNNYKELSEQNLVDCVPTNMWCNGCSGGWMDGAFIYAKRGVASGQDYPYTARDGYCQANKRKAAYDVGSVKVDKTIYAFQKALDDKGPLSIAADISGKFQHYKSGVYSNSYCNKKNIQHAMLAVGYETDQGRRSWIIKNSWGDQWGAGGYVKMAGDDSCGVVHYASYPDV